MTASMTPLLFALPGNEQMASLLAPLLRAETGKATMRRFPDGETYWRYDTPVAGRDVALLCTLDRPDDKLPALLFAAAAARDLQARRVGLIAPYLAYMRQDHRFQPGEAISSATFARIVSGEVDWLITVDPHLHRRASLDEIYSVPTRALHAAPLIAQWISDNVPDPLLIGPDRESEQWVAAVARGAGAAHIVLRKTRRGDRDVEVAVPDLAQWRGRTPVLVDDIVSSGQTMVETLKHLKDKRLAPPVCIGVHGIFAGNALAGMKAAGAARIVTTNTIAHETNGIDVSGLLAEGVRALMG
jgi:ribose-phosphate pyrophosphokinase